MGFGTAEAIQAGISVANGIAGVITNRQNRKWSEKMYNRQRQDALSDWALQNEYNHPSNQMARAREAGINPHIAFGKGATPSASVGNSSVPNYKAEAPQFEFDPYRSIMNNKILEVQQAEIDKTRVQMTVLANDAALKAANTALTQTRNTRENFNLQFAQDTKETAIRNLQLLGDKTAQDIAESTTRQTVQLAQNQRAEALQQPNLSKAWQAVRNMQLQEISMKLQNSRTKEETENLRETRRKLIAERQRTDTLTALDEAELDLRRNGYSFKDSPVWRLIERYLAEPENAGEDVNRVIKGIIKGVIKSF